MQNEVVQKSLGRFTFLRLSLFLLLPFPPNVVAENPRNTLNFPTTIGPVFKVLPHKEPLWQKPSPPVKKKSPARLTGNRQVKKLSYWQKLHKKYDHPIPSINLGPETRLPPTPETVLGYSEFPMDRAIVDKWSAKMKEYGSKYCALLKSNTATGNEILADVYYDAAHVYHQIQEYTRDTDWQECVDASLRIYRDQYVLPNSGRVPGYWNFSDGLLQSYIQTDDTESLNAILELASDASYSNEQTPVSWTQPFTLSREVSYAIITYLNSEQVGHNHQTRLNAFVNQGLGHLDQWFGSRNAPYVRSFMVGLTARALIRYWERTGDPRIVAALSFSMDRLWDLNWVEAQQAFRYQSAVSESSNDTKAAPDLNLLIAPAYAWIAYVTGDTEAARRADKIFASGVNAAYLERPKQFNQNYFWSFDYIRWRSAIRILQ
jgi:hypothetical protein